MINYHYTLLYVAEVEATVILNEAEQLKPWGQSVAYVLDCNGFLIALCTAMQHT